MMKRQVSYIYDFLFYVSAGVYKGVCTCLKARVMTSNTHDDELFHGNTQKGTRRKPGNARRIKQFSVAIVKLFDALVGRSYFI